MSGRHWITSELHSRVDLETSDLGLSAFNGEVDTIKAALERGIDWDVEGQYLLEAAIHGNQIEIAKLLLRSGMPMRDEYYPLIYYWSPDSSLRQWLPPCPEITNPITREISWGAFLHAITEEDLEGVKKNFLKEKINDEDASLGDRVSRKPIHLAARKCHLGILKFLVREGADVHSLDGEGKSVLRIIAECPTAEKEERRECYKFIEERGGKLVPEVEGWFRKWGIRRGNWLSE